MAIMQAAVTAPRRTVELVVGTWRAADKADSGYGRPYTAPPTEPAMREPARQITVASAIMVQFLGWVAERPRTRSEALEGWHSCPHISALEDAIVGGFIRFDNDGSRTVRLTSRGRAALEQAHAAAP
jgi:hypothetical protein